VIIRRSRRLHVQPAQYESIEFGAEIEFDTTIDVPKTADPVEWADQYLTDLLEKEVEEAYKASTSNQKSFIHTYRYTEEEED